MSYLIRNNRVIATVSETLKSGQSVRVAPLRQGKNLVNAVYATVSNAKKYKKESYMVDSAVLLSEGEYYTGDDKPVEMFISDTAKEKAASIAKIINSGDTKKFEKLSQSLISARETLGSNFWDKQVDVMVILECDQDQAIDVMNLYK